MRSTDNQWEMIAKGALVRRPKDHFPLLRRLGRVHLLIAGWPCQGHSRGAAGRGL